MRFLRVTAATATVTIITAAAAATMYMSVDGPASGSGADEGEKVIKAHHAFNTIPSDKLKIELSNLMGEEAVYYSY